RPAGHLERERLPAVRRPAGPGHDTAARPIRRPRSALNRATPAGEEAPPGSPARAGSASPSGRRSPVGASSPGRRARPLRAACVADVAEVSEQIRVLVVDDDALVRAGLSMLLAGADDIEIVGEAADGNEVENAVAEH